MLSSVSARLDLNRKNNPRGPFSRRPSVRSHFIPEHSSQFLLLPLRLCRADGAPWQQSPLSTGLLWLGKEMWGLSFVFNTSDLLCFKISPSQEQMPRNGTAGQAAPAALHSPLAAVREKQCRLFYSRGLNKIEICSNGRLKWWRRNCLFWGGGGCFVLGRITDRPRLFKILGQSMCFIWSTASVLSKRKNGCYQEKHKLDVKLDVTQVYKNKVLKCFIDCVQNYVLVLK